MGQGGYRPPLSQWLAFRLCQYNKLHLIIFGVNLSFMSGYSISAVAIVSWPVAGSLVSKYIHYYYVIVIVVTIIMAAGTDVCSAAEDDD